MRSGPTLTILASCTGCEHHRSKSYTVQSDSGWTYSCVHPKNGEQHIGHSSATPFWCPERRYEPTNTGSSSAAELLGQVSADLSSLTSADPSSLPSWLRPFAAALREYVASETASSQRKWRKLCDAVDGVLNGAERDDEGLAEGLTRVFGEMRQRAENAEAKLASLRSAWATVLLREVKTPFGGGGYEQRSMWDLRDAFAACDHGSERYTRETRAAMLRRAAVLFAQTNDPQTFGATLCDEADRIERGEP